MTDHDTTNRFAVGLRGEHVTVMLPLPPMLTTAEALNLAAYLVATADDGSFEGLLEAVMDT